MIRQRKIRFIEPQGRPGRPFNAWITKWPLLGPIILASILERRGFDVAIYNENISGSLLQNSDALDDVCSADVVGISIMTPTAARGYALADHLRERAPRPTIVFGGVHATFRPEEAIAHGDVVVRGEGEPLIERVASGEIAQGIHESDHLKDLDSLPALNHFLVRDFDRILKRARRRELYPLPVMTSRGCPYGCEYCTVTRMFGRKVRRQSVQKVYDDVRQYADQGFRHLFFYDDNFTVYPDWTRDLLKRLTPLDIRFNAQVRADFYWRDGARRTRPDHALLRAMRRAGADVLYVGYETVDDATAREWRKGYAGDGALVDRLAQDTRVLHDNGFWIHAMFVMGPQHNERSARRIVDFARANAIESMQISILTPFPGTPIMERLRPHIFLNDFPSDWDYYDGAHCVYDHGRLGVGRFQKTVLEAHRRFYRSAAWDLKRLRAQIRQEIGAPDKLAVLWSQARTAGATLRAWKRETRAFLQTVKARLPRLALDRERA